MNGRELRGENVSLPHNWGSNKTSCGACGSAGEELSQDERWHTDETKIADTDETKIADTWDYYQQWEYINRMAGEGKNILLLLALMLPGPSSPAGPLLATWDALQAWSIPTSSSHSPLCEMASLSPRGQGRYLGIKTPHQFLVPCNTAYERSHDHLLLSLSS